MESLSRARDQCLALEEQIGSAQKRLLEFRMRCSTACEKSRQAAKSLLEEDPVLRSLSRAKSEAARCEAVLGFREAESAMAKVIELWNSVAANYQMAHVVDACPE